MRAPDFDIVYFSEPRFPGGTSTAMVNEFAALARAGIVPAYCPVLSPVFQTSRPFHEGIARYLDTGKAVLVDPREKATARLALVQHPALFENLPPDLLAIKADRVVLVLQHPPLDGHGASNYDLAKLLANLREVFWTDILVAPVGPAVRRQLPDDMPAGVRVTEADWHNLLDFSCWKVRAERPQCETIVVGRHSRPQLTKWPDTLEDAVAAYPARQDIRIRMLGAPPGLAEHYGSVPDNWELIEFTAGDTKTFLHSLDFYVFFHGAQWVEAFGYSILEAIAAGIPVILPHHFCELFGDAAIYALPKDVAEIIDRLSGDRKAYARQVATARQYAEARFSLDRFVPRLRGLVPGLGDAKPKRRAVDPPQSRRVMFMTSNGIGLGHLTRSMAIARRLPAGTEVAIFTLSQAFRLAVEQGFLTQFVPFHSLTGANVDRWNAALAEELLDFLSLFRPDTVVFDGNVPYRGMLQALDMRPGIKRVWVRRALWSGTNAKHTQNSRRFDLVLEPEEFSSRFDTGPTQHENAVNIPPVLNVVPGDRLSRADARRELGLSEGTTAVAMMLGAGNNFRFAEIRELLIDRLVAEKTVELLEFVHPVGNGAQVASEEKHRRKSCYPAFRYSRAFDAMIASAGYNTFHENLYGAVPTLFVPNESPEMDRQILRARHASRAGVAAMLRATDRIGIDATLAQILDPATRQEMQRRMRQLTFIDGAVEAAEIIDQFSHATRMVQGFVP